MKNFLNIVLMRLPVFFAGAGMGQGVNLIKEGNMLLGYTMLIISALVTIALFWHMIAGFKKTSNK